MGILSIFFDKDLQQLHPTEAILVNIFTTSESAWVKRNRDL
jgi:hypothetical protein